MSRTQTVDRDHQQQIIADAIRDRRPLTVTFSLADGWRRFKGAFVSGSPDRNEALIGIDLPRDGAVLEGPPVGATIGGTFRLGHKKCMFSADVRDCRTLPNAVQLAINWPRHFSQLQRRAYERAAPPSGTVIAVRFWRGGAGSGAADLRDVRHGQLEDISAGGLRIKVADSLPLELEKTYKCVFAPGAGKPSFVLDAILRHREAAENGRASLGFQFVGLESSPEGLRTLDRLARLVSIFQRSANRTGSDQNE